VSLFLTLRERGTFGHLLPMFLAVGAGRPQDRRPTAAAPSPARNGGSNPKSFLAKVGEGRSIGEYRKDQIVFSQGALRSHQFLRWIDREQPNDRSSVCALYKHHPKILPSIQLCRPWSPC